MDWQRILWKHPQPLVQPPTTIMPRPNRWWGFVRAARDEACLAVDLHNRSNEPRSFEAFVVHVHLAWLYLLQAEMVRDGVDYRYHRNARCLEYVDGEPKLWDLARSVAYRFPEKGPVRANLEFFVALRNTIEHRYSSHEDALSLASVGHVQALLLNFDNELVDQFGDSQTLAARLRFPIFVGTFSESGDAPLPALQKRLPKALQRFLRTYHAALDPTVADDQRFAFCLRLIPEVSPHTGDSLPIAFTRLEDLEPAAREALRIAGRDGRVFVREQKRAIANFGRLKPGEAARRVQDGIPFIFKLQPHFVAAYRTLSVRPASNDPYPQRTREEFCIYDEVHSDYTYTPAFVKYLQRELSTPEGFRRITGRDPEPLAEVIDTRSAG